MAWLGFLTYMNSKLSFVEPFKCELNPFWITLQSQSSPRLIPVSTERIAPYQPMHAGKSHAHHLDPGSSLARHWI